MLAPENHAVAVKVPATAELTTVFQVNLVDLPVLKLLQLQAATR